MLVNDRNRMLRRLVVGGGHWSHRVHPFFRGLRGLGGRQVISEPFFAVRPDPDDILLVCPPDEALHGMTPAEYVLHVSEKKAAIAIFLTCPGWPDPAARPDLEEYNTMCAALGVVTLPLTLEPIHLDATHRAPNVFGAARAYWALLSLLLPGGHHA